MFVQKKHPKSSSYAYRVWDIRYVDETTTMFLIYSHEDEKWKWVDSSYYIPFIGD